MQNIRDILSGLGIEVPEDKATELDRLVIQNYRAIDDYKRVQQRADDLAAQLDAANDAIKAAQDADTSNADEMAQLKAKLDEYEKADAERQAKADEEKAKADFDGEFDEAIGDRQFASRLAGDAVRAKAFDMRKLNPNMAAADILSAVIGDDDVWANPQRDPKKMPGSSDTGAQGVASIQNIEDVQAMTTDEINEHWDEVSKILAAQGK